MYVNRKGCSNGLLTDHCRLPLGQRLLPESTGKAGQGIPGRCFSSRRSKSTMQKTSASSLYVESSPSGHLITKVLRHFLLSHRSLSSVLFCFVFLPIYFLCYLVWIIFIDIFSSSLTSLSSFCC